MTKIKQLEQKLIGLDSSQNIVKLTLATDFFIGQIAYKKEATNKFIMFPTDGNEVAFKPEDVVKLSAMVDIYIK